MSGARIFWGGRRLQKRICSSLGYVAQLEEGSARIDPARANLDECFAERFEARRAGRHTSESW
jgi:hypothetical protein